MLKVLIADDEPHFRIYMEHVLDWEGLGFKICGICKNGEEALQKVKDTAPDIVLLDINMPGMNGITLAEHCKQMNPDLYIVFITGYSEFEYARKAVQIGVDEYLLKPFSREELTNIVYKLKLKIWKRNEQKHLQRADLQIVREELLRRWVGGISQLKIEEFKRSLERIDIRFPGRFYLVSVLEIDDISGMWKNQEDVELWKFGIGNIAQEVLGEITQAEITHLIFNGMEDRVISILNYDHKLERITDIKKYYEQVSSLISQHLGFTISIGIGNPVTDMTEVSKSYRKALAALEEKFLLGGSRVICYEEVDKVDSEATFYRLDLNDQLLACLRKQQREEIHQILEETHQNIVAKHLPTDYAYMMISGMMSICLSYITEMNGNISDIFGGGFSPYSELYKKTSLNECLAFLQDVFGKTMDAFQSNYSKRGAEIISMVEEYIAENYSDCELTVEKIAEGVYLDSSYLRRIVSRQLGCTISDLLTNVRMKEAKKLMEEAEMTVTMVSEKVGYSEPGYFSKCFKKYYGVSPKKFICPVFYQ